VFRRGKLIIIDIIIMHIELHTILIEKAVRKKEQGRKKKKRDTPGKQAVRLTEITLLLPCYRVGTL